MAKHDSSNTISFQIPSNARFNELKSSITDFYNRDAHIRYANAIIELIGTNFTVTAEGKKEQTSDYIPKEERYSYYNYNAIKLCTLIHACKENLNIILSLMDKPTRKAIKMIVEQGYVSIDEFKQAGINNLIVKEKRGWGIYDMLKPIFSLYIMFRNRTYDNTEPYGIFVKIPDMLRSVYVQTCLPEKSNPSSWILESINNKLHTASTEHIITASFPVIKNLVKTKQIEPNKLKIAYNVASKTMKTLKIDEAISESLNGVYKVSLGQYILPSLYYAIKDKPKAEVHKVIKDASEYITDGYASLLLPALLPHIKGFRANKIDDHNIRGNYGKALIDALKIAKSNWVDLNALSFLSYNYLLDKIECGSFLTAQFFEDCSLRNDIIEEFIHIGKQHEQIDTEMIRASAYALYGLGIVEIAYDTSTKNSCPCEHIKAARLTNLGKYVVGLTKEYTITQIDTSKTFELDSNRLIVRTLDPNSPYEALLNEVAVKIGKDRYLTDYSSFLNNCKNLKSVEDKITYFQNYICNDIPPLWQEFFEELKQRCNFMIHENSESYKIYKITSPKDKIINIIRNNPEIRSMIIMAEDYRILIPTNNMKEFQKIMRANGFIIPS
ncbi:MAG: hypothetical protein KBS95_00885 [Alistipes sp.]|nr:hypothetical protein [Candidatus Alistipes equi]